MWYETTTSSRRTSKFFRIALSHETLANYIQTNFGLIQHHNWSLTELENMMPWERDIYTTLLQQYIEEENLKRQQAEGVRKYG